MWKNLISRLGLGGSILLVVGAMIASTAISFAFLFLFQRASNVLMEQQLSLAERQADLERKKKETEMMQSPPPPSTFVAPRVTNVRVFSCSTAEERETGFARGDVQDLSERNVSYRFLGGCALVRANVPIKELVGGEFVIQEAGVYKDGYHGCGTYQHLMTARDSANCLNDLQGQVLRLIVVSGGPLMVISKE